jgi:hypothetical protein
VCISEVEIQLSEEYTNNIYALKSQIQNAVTRCASSIQVESNVHKPAASVSFPQREDRLATEALMHNGCSDVPSGLRPQLSPIKHLNTSLELSGTKPIEAEPELESSGMLSL